ncbi:Rid family hydrolase [Streptomyces sp. NPDC057236]|uniref:Rid family hydrolase n=1 Tax=Streptomyces sp. NPDC057236 TaxID=3346059 RepID=UPI003635FE43
MTVQRIDPPGLHAAPGLISQLVVTTGRRLVHLSGRVARDSHGHPTGGDHAARAAAIARNITTALAAAGATRDDIVKEVIYIAGYTPEAVPALEALDGQQDADAVDELLVDGVEAFLRAYGSCPEAGRPRTGASR